MSKYAFPIERPIPRDAFDLASTLGAVRWAAWRGTGGVRLGVYTPGSVLNDTGGVLAWNIASSKISLAMDGSGLALIAVQYDATTIKVNHDPEGAATIYTFAGLTPVLFFTGLYVAGATAVICFYIKTGGTTVYMRFGSEAFATEHTAITGFDVVLDTLQKSDVLLIGSLVYHFLWAMDNTGRQITFHTLIGLPPPDQPPPFPYDDMESYTHGVSVNGLNGGTGGAQGSWDGGYVDS